MLLNLIIILEGGSIIIPTLKVKELRHRCGNDSLSMAISLVMLDLGFELRDSGWGPLTLLPSCCVMLAGVCHFFTGLHDRDHDMRSRQIMWC